MNTKELIVWALGLLLGAAVLLSPVACTMRRHQVIADAIKGGADPIAAKCAIEADLQQSAMCVSASITRRQQ